MKTYSFNAHNAETILFLNPLGCDHSFWKSNITSELMDKYHLLFVDYPGYNCEFEELPKIHQLLDRIYIDILKTNTKPIHIVGYSYGGIIVQHLLNFPINNLKSVTIVASANTLTKHDKEVVSILKEIIKSDMFLYCRALNAFSHAPEAITNNPLLALQSFSNLKNSTKSIDPIVQQMNHVLKINTIAINTNETPTLFIYGEHDKLLEMKNIDNIERNLPNLKIEKLKDEHHIINMEKIMNPITSFINKNSHE